MHVSSKKEKDKQESVLYDDMQELQSITSKLGTELKQAQIVLRIFLSCVLQPMAVLWNAP
jgi:hypothetical protein